MTPAHLSVRVVLMVAVALAAYLAVAMPAAAQTRITVGKGQAVTTTAAGPAENEYDVNFARSAFKRVKTVRRTGTFGAGSASAGLSRTDRADPPLRGARRGLTERTGVSV